MNNKEHNDNSSIMTRRLDQCLHYGFHFLVIIIPLIISYEITYDQFDLAKLTFLRIITVFLLLCFATKMIVENKVKIKRTSLDIPIILFLALITLSTIFSIHPATSVFGKYKRYEGLLTYVNYVILFFLASQFFKSIDQVRSVAYSMVITAGAVSFYGLLQHFDLDFLTWLAGFESGRSFSTFGNPVLLGGYLVIVLPISLSLLFFLSELKQRIAIGASLFLIFSCLIMTFSRSALLGGFLGLVGFFVVGWRGFEAKKKVILLIFSFAVIVISIFGLSSLFSVRSAEFLKERISTGIAVKGSALTRLEISKSAVKMIEARPFLGFGPDCFRLAFRKYQTLRYARLVGEASIADNAHNYFLQLASTAGIPAFFAFVAIIGVFILLAWRSRYKFKERKDCFITYGLMLSVMGYLFHLFFGISVVGSTTLLWLILGMVAGLSPSSVVDLKWHNQQNLRKALSVIVLLASLLLVSISCFPFLADFHFAEANDLAEIGYYDRSVVQYQEAFRYFPYTDLYYNGLGSLNIKWAKATNERKYFDDAVDALETAREVNLLESDNYLQLALIYFYGAEHFDSLYYSKAIENLKKVLILEPYSSRAYYLLGASYVDRGYFKKAVKNLKRAVDITSNLEDAYFYLGLSYERLGQVKRAVHSYRKALSINSNNRGAEQALKRLESKK